MIEYKKTRSKFWLKIFDDEATHTNISANKMVMGLLQEISPHLISCSPKGWKESSNIPGNYNLWIPNDRMDWEALENVERQREPINTSGLAPTKILRPIFVVMKWTTVWPQIGISI